MEEKIVTVLNEMSEYLSIAQMKKLQEVIIKTFAENEAAKTDIANDEFLKMFLAAKRIEGCSDRTIGYYQTTVKHMLSKTENSVRKITTEEMREYLSNYQKRNDCSNVTIDNVRRNISSFFSWLKNRFLASCWVMVLPPSAKDIVRISFQSARPMAMTSIPPWDQKR